MGICQQISDDDFDMGDKYYRTTDTNEEVGLVITCDICISYISIVPENNNKYKLKLGYYNYKKIDTKDKDKYLKECLYYMDENDIWARTESYELTEKIISNSEDLEVIHPDDDTIPIFYDILELTKIE